MPNDVVMSRTRSGAGSSAIASRYAVANRSRPASLRNRPMPMPSLPINYTIVS